jgi:Arc/MetJ family transcription regulator
LFTFGMEPAALARRQTGMRPFIGTEALAAGTVNRYQLSTRYTAVHRNVYVPVGAELTAKDKALASWLWSGRRATAAGLSAAALHGSRWIDAELPAELFHSSRHPTRGIVLHGDQLSDGETCSVGGVAATTPARTAFDIGRRPGLTDAVIHLDALMQATRLVKPAIDVLVDRHAGARGIVQLRAAIDLADGGAESPQETRTRLLLTSAGLPPTHTQIEVYDHFGYFVARIDMGWVDWAVGVEYDGVQHWTDPTQRMRDIDRIAELEALGWRVVRVSSQMLRYRPHTIVDRAVTALRAAGHPAPNVKS